MLGRRYFPPRGYRLAFTQATVYYFLVTLEPTSGRVASVGQALASHPGAGPRKRRIGAVLFEAPDFYLLDLYS